ncbi:MAG: metal-dependent transcriptional regulator [Lentisphaerae bacterium]|nr:metal-dependent transcriptional regulator [Lentisphaerota bacterium]
MSLSQSVENILKAIYDLQLGDQWVSTSALADRLGQKPASVTNMIQRLARAKASLVDYTPYRGARLNPTGVKVALEIIRHHRLIELYLAQTLGVPWDRVHDEAERLEHVISEDLEDRMAAALADPRLDPHGSPIPTKDGQIAAVVGVPLSEAPMRATVRVTEVRDEDANLLRYLGAMGLYPGAEFTVTGREPFGGSLHIRFNDQDLHLGEEALPHIRVAVQT